MRIIGIDPGLKATGLAWNDRENKLQLLTVRPRTRSIREKAREIVREIPDLCWDWVIIEVPQVYQGGKQKGDPNDLINLAILVGHLEALISSYHVMEVRPTAWKGSVPKDIHHKRLLARAPGITSRKWSRDALDALGLFYHCKDLVEAKQRARRNRRAL